MNKEDEKYMCAMEYHSTLKKNNEILPFATSQRKTNTAWYDLHVECEKQGKQTWQNRDRLIDTEDKLVIVRGEEGRGMSDVGEGD